MKFDSALGDLQRRSDFFICQLLSYQLRNASFPLGERAMLFSSQSASGMKNECFKNFRRNSEAAVRYSPDGSKQIGFDFVVRNKAVSTAQQNRAQLCCRKRVIDHQN